MLTLLKYVVTWIRTAACTETDTLQFEHIHYLQFRIQYYTIESIRCCCIIHWFPSSNRFPFYCLQNIPRSDFRCLLQIVTSFVSSLDCGFVTETEARVLIVCKISEWWKQSDTYYISNFSLYRETFIYSLKYFTKARCIYVKHGN